MLTIFTIPKPFRGHIRTIQNNAIRSWVTLCPACEVILFGNEEGTTEIAAELGTRHIPGIECNNYGTPLVSSTFEIAQSTAQNQLMCYVNADIILMSNFLAAVQRVSKYPFLIVGQRWDLDLNEPIDFSDTQWEHRLKTRVAEYGKLHSESGIDYFVFPRGLYEDIPPFAVGRAGWDNWMIYHARYRKIPVIDATRVITAVHQNHNYAHHPGDKKGVFKGPEAQRNRELLGGSKNSFGIQHATWLFTPQGLRRALTVKHLYYRLDAVPVLVPHLRFLGIPKKTMIALSKAIRAMLGIAHGRNFS